MTTSRRRSQAYDWITAEEVARHALAAYYALCRKADAYRAYYPDGDFDPRHQFAEDLGEVFAVRLLEQGFRTTTCRDFPPGMDEYLRGLLDTSNPEASELCHVTEETPQDIHRRQSHNGNA